MSLELKETGNFRAILRWILFMIRDNLVINSVCFIKSFLLLENSCESHISLDSKNFLEKLFGMGDESTVGPKALVSMATDFFPWISASSYRFCLNLNLVRLSFRIANCLAILADSACLAAFPLSETTRKIYLFFFSTYFSIFNYFSFLFNKLEALCKIVFTIIVSTMEWDNFENWQASLILSKLQQV